jgi:hypothetical protein
MKHAAGFEDELIPTHEGSPTIRLDLLSPDSGAPKLSHGRKRENPVLPNLVPYSLTWRWPSSPLPKHSKPSLLATHEGPLDKRPPIAPHEPQTVLGSTVQEKLTAASAFTATHVRREKGCLKHSSVLACDGDSPPIMLIEHKSDNPAPKNNGRILLS